MTEAVHVLWYDIEHVFKKEYGAPGVVYAGPDGDVPHAFFLNMLSHYEGEVEDDKELWGVGLSDCTNDEERAEALRVRYPTFDALEHVEQACLKHIVVIRDKDDLLDFMSDNGYLYYSRPKTN